ncbi:hypothetical protein ACFV4P_03225 [Kitasatospora sp. NPDC059795]|uniref:hypothetical protein n=1 Tax=Kitasatospora sp. NPDC059795 TaxID=3346949 RepID=UPI00365241D1
MICPHCRTSLTRRERPEHRCSRCRRAFALDPKVEPGRLHDIKFRELVAKGTGGRLQITVEQLYWLNERRLYGFPGPRDRRRHIVFGSLATAAALGAAAVAVLADAALLPGAIALFATGRAIQDFHSVWRMRAGAPLHPKLSPIRFQYQVIDRWREVYGALPPGLVDDPPPAVPTPALAKARAVVLCELSAVTAFLRANDFARRHQVLLVDELAKVPAGLPVVVLRDLSLSALTRTVAIRAALPGRRVVDAGLAPRAVLEPAKAIRLHDLRKPQVPAALAAAPGWRRLTGRERAWLTSGRYSPLITLPPTKLLILAEKAVHRATTAPPSEPPDQARRRAQQIGFLTWPTAPPTDGAAR